MKYLKQGLLVFGGMAIFSQATLAASGTTYSANVPLKKQIIKAILEEVDAGYLSTIENPIWKDLQFYDDVSPLAGIGEKISNETSGFVPVGGHSLVLDGDMVKQETHVFLDDIPGRVIVVYDEKKNGTLGPINIIRDADYMKLHGHDIESSLSPGQGIIAIFDCLQPGSYTCDDSFTNVVSKPYGPTVSNNPDKTEPSGNTINSEIEALESKLKSYKKERDTLLVLASQDLDQYEDEIEALEDSKKDLKKTENNKNQRAIKEREINAAISKLERAKKTALEANNKKIFDIEDLIDSIEEEIDEIS